MGEGTGLGLDIVQRIIRRQHRGDIRVESRRGSTVFTVLLPLEGAIHALPSNGEEEADALV
jgi:signal transduction histidine kinase